MKLEIYNEKKNDKIVYLKLVKSSYSDGIDLIAVDNGGNELEEGNLLGISSNGMDLSPAINPKIGLPLDKNGKLIICK